MSTLDKVVLVGTIIVFIMGMWMISVLAHNNNNGGYDRFGRSNDPAVCEAIYKRNMCRQRAHKIVREGHEAGKSYFKCNYGDVYDELCECEGLTNRGGRWGYYPEK